MTRSVVIPRAEVRFRTSRSSGPGGQHAQKSETRVEAVFDVEASEALTDAQKSAWKKAMLPVHKENESRVGKDTIEAVYRAVDFKP